MSILSPADTCPLPGRLVASLRSSMTYGDDEHSAALARPSLHRGWMEYLILSLIWRMIKVGVKSQSDKYFGIDKVFGSLFNPIVPIFMKKLWLA
jgi:hypothetical protein